MNFLIKIFFLIFSFNLNAIDVDTSRVLFKLNNKVFTNIDFDKRIKYIQIANGVNYSDLNKSEKKEIYNDYISSMIFNEYQIKNKLISENISDETMEITKEITNSIILEKEEIEFIKSNIRSDLIRKKILEQFLNSKKNIILEKTNSSDLLYNYNVNYLIIKTELVSDTKIKNITNRENFYNFKEYLIKNKISYFFKEEDITNQKIISSKIKLLIKNETEIEIFEKNGYLNIISIEKNFESYEGVFVNLINIISDNKINTDDLNCDKIKSSINQNKTIYKEYEYSKLNQNIKKNLKAINDYVLLTNNGTYNYIFLCNISFDEQLLSNININKKISILAKQIEYNFLREFRQKYNFINYE